MKFDQDKFVEDAKERGVHPAIANGKPWARHGGMEQNPFEIADFVAQCAALDVRTYLEVGLSGGDTFALVSKWLSIERPHGVDIKPPRVHVAGSDVLVASTRSERFAEWIGEIKSIDAILIDASHDFASIQQDAMLCMCLNPRIVGFHDIAGLRDCGDAKRHWNVVGRHLLPRSKEFIAAEDPCGIGATWRE